MSETNSGKPRVSRANGQATRERLLLAAIELMAEGGEASVSLATTARRAGVTRGTMYHHFRSKDHLLSEMNASLETHLLRLSDGSAGFAHPFGLIPRLAAEDESYIRSRMHRMLEHGFLADARTVSLMERFRGMSAEGQLKPGADPDAAALMASAMDLAGLLFISVGGDAAQRRQRAAAFGRAVYQLFCHGVIDVEAMPDFPNPNADI